MSSDAGEEFNVRGGIPDAHGDEQIVAALDALTGDDEERDHMVADMLILRLVNPEVIEAWHRAHDRIGFWYS